MTTGSTIPPAIAVGMIAIVTACSPSTEARTASSATAAAQAPAGQGPCALLTNDEVRRIFPDAKNGTLKGELEKHGIRRCAWDYPGGLLLVMTGEEDQTPAEEAREWAITFLDPLNGTAINRVRFETIAGVGDAAVAVVERADKAKGFMQDGSYIVVRRGKSQVLIAASGMSNRERPAALAALTDLGKAAAGRLR